MEERKNVIECRNLTHYYGKKLVYENLNISVGEGRILGLAGQERCGQEYDDQYPQRISGLPARVGV